MNNIKYQPHPWHLRTENNIRNHQELILVNPQDKLNFNIRRNKTIIIYQNNQIEHLSTNLSISSTDQPGNKILCFPAQNHQFHKLTSNHPKTYNDNHQSHPLITLLNLIDLKMWWVCLPNLSSLNLNLWGWIIELKRKVVLCLKA